ncbi:hypothetical protein MIND_00621600 [Mycena indigotica]|uniref:Uncharacterized protein n=1 Tax=Mycena indigotica TaxID=2126181 RepID=A0A8H6SSK2_9AGAR|nr:uncharacterized protein MIND_00621600 [Mycena indigotica]KAF7303911.1 hypothetical protein MIND_00621600 [Mycena indigotica]
MRFPVSILFLIATVYGRLVNVTLDDTSSQIIYNNPPYRCTTSSICDTNFQSGLFNETSSTTTTMIIIPFSGTAAYVYLGINGTAIFQLDGLYVGEYGGTNVNTITPALALHNLSDRLHVLTIVGVDPVRWDIAAAVQLDSFVYTSKRATNHTGAIVGGVVGGLVCIALIYLGMTLLRRRQQSKRAARGSWFRGKWTDKPSIQMEGMEVQK